MGKTERRVMINNLMAVNAHYTDIACW